MHQYMISVTTMKCVSTVQIKYNDEYVVTNSNWKEGREIFPVGAIIKGVYRIIKKRLIKRFPVLKLKTN